MCRLLKTQRSSNFLIKIMGLSTPSAFALLINICNSWGDSLIIAYYISSLLRSVTLVYTVCLKTYGIPPPRNTSSATSLQHSFIHFLNHPPICLHVFSCVPSPHSYHSFLDVWAEAAASPEAAVVWACWVIYTGLQSLLNPLWPMHGLL